MHHSILRKHHILIPLAGLALAMTGSGDPTNRPAWWLDGNPPILAGTPENNHGPANIGQAKWMVSEALRALEPIAPAIATQIRADLAGTGSNFSDRILDLTVPADPKPADWADIQKAPLLIGQLKAIAAPFYTLLDATNATWLAAERTTNSTNQPGSIFPWTTETSDDANHAIATIGQLKAVFSLRFDTLPFVDTDADGLADAWELLNFSNLDQIGSGDFDHDGLTNLQEYLSGTNPLKPDTDDDGMDDRPELAAGFDPKSNDENHNGRNDGFEDFDGDTYINREEALCGTDARKSTSKPNGGDASMVNIGGIETPVLLVRNHTFDLQSIRSATYSKQGFPGLLPGSVHEQGADTASSGGNEKAIVSRTKYYLKRETAEDWFYESFGENIENGPPYSTTQIGYKVRIDGILTTWDDNLKEGLDYVQHSSQEGSENASGTNTFDDGSELNEPSWDYNLSSPNIGHTSTYDGLARGYAGESPGFSSEAFVVGGFKMLANI